MKMPAPFNYIFHFLCSAGNKTGLVVFESLQGKRAWLYEHESKFMEMSCTRMHGVYVEKWVGSEGNTLVLLAHTTEYETRYRLQGHRFDKIWFTEDVPLSVQDVVRVFEKPWKQEVVMK